MTFAEFHTKDSSILFKESKLLPLPQCDIFTALIYSVKASITHSLN